MSKAKTKSPKMKTRKGVAKRFKVTSTGKIVRRKSNHNHILEKKAPKRKRQHRRVAQLAPGDAAKVRKQLGL